MEPAGSASKELYDNNMSAEAGSRTTESATAVRVLTDEERIHQQQKMHEATGGFWDTVYGLCGWETPTAAGSKAQPLTEGTYMIPEDQLIAIYAADLPPHYQKIAVTFVNRAMRFNVYLNKALSLQAEGSLDALDFLGKSKVMFSLYGMVKQLGKSKPIMDLFKGVYHNFKTVFERLTVTRADEISRHGDIQKFLETITRDVNIYPPKRVQALRLDDDTKVYLELGAQYFAAIGALPFDWSSPGIWEGNWESEFQLCRPVPPDPLLNEDGEEIDPYAVVRRTNSLLMPWWLSDNKNRIKQYSVNDLEAYQGKLVKLEVEDEPNSEEIANVKSHIQRLLEEQSIYIDPDPQELHESRMYIINQNKVLLDLMRQTARDSDPKVIERNKKRRDIQAIELLEFVEFYLTRHLKYVRYHHKAFEPLRMIVRKALRAGVLERDMKTAFPELAGKFVMH